MDLTKSGSGAEATNQEAVTGAATIEFARPTHPVWAILVFWLRKMVPFAKLPGYTQKQYDAIMASWEAEADHLTRAYQRTKARTDVINDQKALCRKDQAPRVKVAFFGTKGASGTTTVLVYTASALGYATKRQILIADLNPGAGNAASRVGQNSTQTITVKPMLAGLKAGKYQDFDSLSLVTEPTIYNVRVIAAEELESDSGDDEIASDISHDDAKLVIQAANRSCEYLFIDTANVITGSSALAAAEEADVFVYSADVSARYSLRYLGKTMETHRKRGFTDKVDNALVVITNLPEGDSLQNYRKFLNIVEDDETERVKREITSFEGAFRGIQHDSFLDLEGVVNLEELQWDTLQDVYCASRAIGKQAVALQEQREEKAEIEVVRTTTDPNPTSPIDTPQLQVSNGESLGTGWALQNARLPQHHIGAQTTKESS